MGRHDEPLFADDLIEYAGQPLFAVAAETRDQARRAARLAVAEYEDLDPVLTTAKARETGKVVFPPMTLKRGDAAEAIAAAPRRLEGRISIGGQDHFYLEGQIAMAIPGEDDEVLVHSSTQHPSEVQHIVAHVLNIPANAVSIEVRRMGGAFGGKETQANLFAATAALVAKKTGRAAKLRPDRDDDMVITGKRHDFEVDYIVGFDDEGRIKGVDFLFAARCGFAADLSGPVTDRALFHCDNTYFYEAVHAQSLPLKTNTVSNTAFRGFGGPQGMVAAERVIEEIAYAVGKDPLEIRKLNFYGEPGRDVTPYHQTVEDNIAPELVADLEARCDYQSRRTAIREHNAKGGILRKGIALTPVKFGISFTATQYNQAGALVHVYTDGSVHLNHGGTEMGQGLYVKVAQVVAEEFQIDIDKVRITATTTGKVPNTSATAASSGADLNGKAAQVAAHTIKERLIGFAVENWGVPARAGRLPAQPRPHRQSGNPLRRSGPHRLHGAHPALLHRLLQDAGNPLGPRRRQRQAVLLLLLRCCGGGSHRRYPHRRVPRGPRRYPPRRRQIAEPRARPGAGGRRLRPGDGLADHGGTMVGPARPPAHPCPQHLQDPGLQRPARRSSTSTCWRTRRTAKTRSTAPRRSASLP